MKFEEKIAVYALILGRLRALDQLDKENCPKAAIDWVSERYLAMKAEIEKEIAADVGEKIEKGELKEITGGFVS